MVELLNIDCMEYMKGLPNKAFDLAIVDPPYGIGENGSTNKSRGKLAKAKNYKPFAGLDKESPSDEYFNELFRVSKNQIIWGANHFLGLTSSCWIVWDKNNGANDFADCELAYTSFSSAVRLFKYTWNGMLQENMKNKEIRIHPTQKPIQLYKWLLHNYAKPTDRILDTHLGSGSSAIAAHEFGVEFVGCELDTDYYNAAVKRFKEQTQQISIW